MGDANMAFVRNSFLATVSFALLALAGCGKYVETKGDEDAHSEEVGSRTGTAEATGNGYVPAFLANGYKTLDVTFDIRESVVDLGNGYKYRALTYDGNFPARTIVVEQGTLVRIRVNNGDDQEHSVHTHVIKYKPESDGTIASATRAGESRSYFWEVTENTPPGFYPFHDHGGPGEGAQARGLVGMVNVVKKGEVSKAGYGILLHDIDPAYLFSTSGAVLPSSAGGAGSGGHAGGHGSGQMASTQKMPAHLINGRYGDSPESRFTVKKGEKLRIGVVNLGLNIHNFHPHGNFFREADGTVNDTLALQPGEYATVTLDAEAVGEWHYHCHVPGHSEGGMFGRYVVE